MNDISRLDPRESGIGENTHDCATKTARAAVRKLSRSRFTLDFREPRVGFIEADVDENARG